MKTYTLYGEKGEKPGETIVSEEQLFPHFKLLLLELWSELGLDPIAMSKYDGDIYRMKGSMIARIRELIGKLETARLEFKKLRDKRDQDYETIMNFIRMFPGVALPENVVELEERRRKAA